MQKKKLLARPLTRRDFLRGAAAVTGTAIVAACAPPSVAPGEGEEAAPAKEAAEVSFVSNHGAEDVPLFEEVVKNFQDANPSIQVKYSNSGNYQEYKDAIATWAAGDTLPDVFYTRGNAVAVRASRNWIIQLDDLIARDADEVNTADLWPSQVHEMKYQDNWYLMPYDLSNLAIYYNKDMFDAEDVSYPSADWDWSTFLEVGKNFVKKDSSGNQVQWGYDGSPSWWWALGILYGNGGKVFTEELDQCIIDNPENAATLQFFGDLINVHHVAPSSAEVPQGVQMFWTGKVAMQLGGSWATMAYRANCDFNWDVQHMPFGTTGKRGILATGGEWSIGANTKDIEAAWKFIKHLSSKESIEILVSKPLRSVPGRQSAVPLWKQTASEGNLPPEHVEVFPAQNQDAWPIEPVVWAEEFLNIESQHFSRIYNGSATAAEVLPEMQAEVNEAIARYKT